MRRLILAAALAALLPASGGAQIGVPVSAPAATGGDSSAAAPSGPLVLEVSLSERTLRAVQGGTELARYPVAVGQPEHPTPQGEFGIRRIIWNPRWVPPRVPWARGKTPKEPGDPDNPMGRVKMFFQEPDYYIHGTSNEA